MKILLTGANGFIGRNLSEFLKDKHQILTPSRRDLDLLDSKKMLEYLKFNSPDLVLHCATTGGNRKQNLIPGILKNDVLIFSNIIAAKKYFSRIIVLGSGAEYDKRFDVCMAREVDFGINIPADDYGKAKFIMAKKAGEVDFITHLRLFGVFGKYEDYQTRFISNSICRALYNLPITINQNVYFDYIYVTDLVKIIEKFINIKSKQTFYNIGSGKQIDLLSIAKIILEVTGKDLPIKILKKGLNKEYTCDISRLRNEYSDIYFTDIRMAISELTDYYKIILPNLDKSLFVDNI